MERILKTPRQPQSTFIRPATKGWRITLPGQPSRIVDTLAVAAASVPPRCPVCLALPCGVVLFERMKFPTAEPEELRGMVRLQLEKTVPYPVEEVTVDFEIAGREEDGSVVLAVAVWNVQLESLCAPLRESGRLPEKITVFAMHLAAACAGPGARLLIYREDEKFVVAVCENGKAGYVHALDAAGPVEFLAELPQILLGAELEGVSSAFSAVHLDAECDDLAEPVGRLLGVPVELLDTGADLPVPGVNLFPAAWQGAREASERMGRLRSLLISAGGVYAAILICAFGWLFWMNGKIVRFDRMLRPMKFEIGSIQALKTRWDGLAPAIDPSRFTVELLFQIQKSMPSDSIRITQFDQTRDQFVIEGEAPTPALAIEFGEQLKGNPGLKDFKFEVSPPAILPNEHAQFRIFGKL